MSCMLGCRFVAPGWVIIVQEFYRSKWNIEIYHGSFIKIVKVE